MNSKLSILLILLLMIAGVGQALATATITATPSNVPKGAYVYGPGTDVGVTAEHNYFFQTVVLTAGDNHAGETVVITLPTGMEIADTDGTGPDGVLDEVSVSGSVAGVAFNTATATTITLNITVAFITGRWQGWRSPAL